MLQGLCRRAWCITKDLTALLGFAFVPWSVESMNINCMSGFFFFPDLRLPISLGPLSWPPVRSSIARAFRLSQRRMGSCLAQKVEAVDAVELEDRLRGVVRASRHEVAPFDAV